MGSLLEKLFKKKDRVMDGFIIWTKNQVKKENYIKDNGKMIVDVVKVLYIGIMVINLLDNGCKMVNQV